MVLAIVSFVEICSAEGSIDDFLKLTEVGTDSSLQKIWLASRCVYAAANVVADMLLLYRCYILWASRKWVIIGPTIISAINAGMAIASVTFEQKSMSTSSMIDHFSIANADTKLFEAFLGVNLLTNLILTGLIGKLWYIVRTTRKHLGYASSNSKGMDNVVSMVLESGLLYPLALVSCLIPFLTVTESLIVIDPLLTIILGIAPTMIIVRVDLGISVEATASASSDPVSQNSVLDIELQPLVHSHLCDFEIARPFPLPPLPANLQQGGFITLSHKGKGNLSDLLTR
ncbi:hypothetical protein GYMLUDRAFT_238935 [Collybiopsis luxurians FD-317 M1]|nr:hypothetical protein GYMLUDRAFT_238935 [Collybiopsis luxurians FD-317 M1]